MRRNILVIIFCVLLILAAWYRTPVSTGYYYKEAMNAFNSKQYEKSIPLFEQALKTAPNNSAIRFNYVAALSKIKPTYSIEKKLYDFSVSKPEDAASAYARGRVNDIRKSLISGLEDNYIYNALSGKNIIRWDINSFPLKVYIKPSSEIPDYYLEKLDSALNQWTNRINFVRFEKVSAPEDANIYIQFVPSETNCGAQGCKYTVAYTEPVITKDNVLKKMNLTFYNTNPREEVFSPYEIYNAALHELGHTLGIMGHSDNRDDVMYSSNDKIRDIYSYSRPEILSLSMKDLRTLVLLYHLQPTISNVKDLKSENFYYTPLILGSTNKLLEQKVKELEKYIKEYPKFATGYINLASVYADASEYDKALSALKVAEKLASNVDEHYYVEYNRAVIFYNQRDYKKSLDYAKRAKDVRDGAEISALINELNELVKRAK